MKKFFLGTLLVLLVAVAVLVFNNSTDPSGNMGVAGTEEGSIVLSYGTSSTSPVFLYRGSEKILEIGPGNRTETIQVRNLVPGRLYTFSLRDQEGKLLATVTCRAGGE